MTGSNDWHVLIRNAQVYDGSGAPPFAADVAITDDRIVSIGTLQGSARLTLDARGMALAPGFIDVHSHDDLAVFLYPDMAFKVMQGITTDVVGNCGLGPVPSPLAARFFRALHPNRDLPQWQNHRAYLGALDDAPPSLNVVLLVGHGTIRYGAMGNERRAPTDREMAEMTRSLEEGLDAGAFGFSTGLIYEPGRYAEAAEIVSLAKKASEAGGLYATHMRNEAAGLLDSISETLHVGEAARIPVQVSHHKAAGRENWGRVGDSLKLIEEAQARGLDATADQYPYTSASTALVAVVQNGTLGASGEGGLGRASAEDVVIASAPSSPSYEGKSLRELSVLLGVTPQAAAEKVIDENGLGAIAVVHAMDENDVQTVLRHPSTMIGSDGIPSLDGKPHPRLYGTFPRVLGHYARDEKLFPLEEAIHRMTGFPAAKFHLNDRGLIREGGFADVVLFDPEAIIDTASYAEPQRYPDGIQHVFVNGVAVVTDGSHTGARPGRALRRPSGSTTQPRRAGCPASQ